jgi:hypothetical protein
MKVIKRSPSAQSRFVAKLRALEAAQFDPIDNGRDLKPGEIYVANESRFNETFMSEPLTAYAVGFRDPNDIAATRRFFAPEVEVSPYFEYTETINAEEFLTEDDDRRAIGAAYKIIEPYKGVTTLGKTEDRGLTAIVDLRTVRGKSNWEQEKVAKLMRRIERNRLKRGVALLSAAATNTAKTWDTSAGKDPDQDIITDLIAAATASGIRPNRVGFGDTAWSKRGLSHRAQNTAGGFASATMTPEALAGILSVDKVYISKERYQSAAATKAEIVNNLVLMFDAMDNADTEDPSNIKCFVSKYEDGGFYRVYVQQISVNLVAITVSYEELTKITSTLGIRKFTVT